MGARSYALSPDVTFNINTMARVKSNNNLSGAIGNIVFVNDGNRSYVRTQPDKIKQTERTKAAASVFGVVSEREKWLRRHLLNGNKGFAIAGVPCFADTFVQGGSSVLRMKFSAKTPRHRNPPNR